MRRPIFWFLWPATQQGPVDHEATQARWERVCPRGPWRLALLIGCTAALLTLVPAVVMALLSAPDAMSVLVTLIVAIPVIGLLARGWVAGTYVSDRGLKVSTVLTTQTMPWGDVVAIEVRPGSRLLGVPLMVDGESVVIATAAGPVRTHVQSASPDAWLRPSAFAAARDRLGTWWRETR